MQPIIGLLVAVDNERKSTLLYDYAHAVEQSGGLPLVLPYVENEETLAHFVSLCDGFLFTGGVDMDPVYYGAEKSPFCGEIQPYRDTLELGVLAHLLKTEKPILGICRGAQVLNVALGGTLYQDLPSEYPSEIAHRQSQEKYTPSHEVNVLPDTPLHTLIGADNMTANSFHHQAVKELGKGLSPMAYAADGVLEAFYGTGKQYLRAYQWHPERLFESNAQNRLLFSDFITQCK